MPKIASASSFARGGTSKDSSPSQREVREDAQLGLAVPFLDSATRYEAEHLSGHIVVRKNMKFPRRSVLAIGLGLWYVIGGGLPTMPSTGWTKEIVFVARDLEDQQAVWLPREIALHRRVDFMEPLVFRFENPTARTHVFEAPGLFESVAEGGVQISRPIRITIAPEESEQIIVDQNRFMNDARVGREEPITYRFYCPLHRADDDMGGTIVVEQ